MDRHAAFLILAGAAGFALAWLCCRYRCANVAAERDRALAAEAATERTTRVWAAELHAAAMNLQGQAEHCAAQCRRAEAQTVFLTALRGVVALIDDLQDRVIPTTGPPTLHLVEMPVEAAVRVAIAGVAAGLAPGHRRWQVAPALAGYVLWADRRAMSQVLQRVLSHVARLSRAGDWIEIGVAPAPDGFMLSVESAPGRGQAAACSDLHEPAGCGPGLGLAQRLMKAHGGSLALPATARAGITVLLWFPPGHVVSPVLLSSPALPDSFAAD